MANTRCKPKNPHPSFPLTAHPDSQWSKKVRGRIHLFGVWSDPDEALDRHHAVATDLHASHTPRRVSNAGPTVKNACNILLGWQQEIENPLVKRILESDFTAGDHIVVDAAGEVFAFEKGRVTVSP